MTVRERIREYVSIVNEDRKIGKKSNLVSIQLMENFENGESIMISCFEAPEINDLTYEIQHFYESGANHNYYLCDNILTTESWKTWHELQKDWNNKGFKQTLFINF